MAHKKGCSDSPARFHLLKRIVGFVIACALLSLLWLNAGSKGPLGNTYNALSQQTEKPAAPALASQKQSAVDAKPHNVTTHSKVSSPAPFPRLPSPDVEEYMAICMAGEYL